MLLTTNVGAPNTSFSKASLVKFLTYNLFPEVDLVELPTKHPIFNGKYKFKHGLPKIHEHDASLPKAFGIIINGRLLCLYTYEADIGDGWEDAEVHNDSEQIRLKALQMGSNILEYIFTN